MVKVAGPETVGVPAKTPAEDKVTPAGKLPADTVNVYGANPPEAVIEEV